MTTDDRVMTILERTNPVSPRTVVDVPMSAQRYLEDIQQRSNAVNIRSTETPTTHRRWAMLGAAAAVITLVVVAAFVIGNDDDDSIVVDTPDVTATTVASATTSTVPPAVSVEGAQAVVDGFVSVYNAGDAAQVFSVLAGDAIITSRFDGSSPDTSVEPEDREEWEQLIVWRTAGGWMLDGATCNQVSGQMADGLTLLCQFATVTDIMQAVGAVPTPTEALFTVVDGSITELHLSYGQPPFDSVAGPFSSWMSEYHPDVVGAGLFTWTNTEEAAEHGRIRAQWAQEWAAWLDEYGCEPTGPCTIPIEDWVAEYDRACVALDVGQLPTQALVDDVRLVPIALTQAAPRRGLTEADEALLEPDLTDGRIAELQQTRLDAMVELGIDERCHPTIG